MNALRELRIRRGWTQRELAARLGVHQTEIAHAERYTRFWSVERLASAAAVLGADDATLGRAVRECAQARSAGP